MLAITSQHTILAPCTYGSEEFLVWLLCSLWRLRKVPKGVQLMVGQMRCHGPAHFVVALTESWSLKVLR